MFFYANNSANNVDNRNPDVLISHNKKNTDANVITPASPQGLVIERIGRRPLLIFGFSTMAVCFGFLTVFLNLQVNHSIPNAYSYGAYLIAL